MTKHCTGSLLFRDTSVQCRLLW